MSLGNALSTSIGKGAGSDRALNDVSLTIGFSMLILVFILIPYLATMQKIAVELPQVEETASSQAEVTQPLKFVITLLADDAGELKDIYVDNSVIKPEETLTDHLNLNFSEELLSSKEVAFTLKADRSLNYEDVIELLNELNSLRNKRGEIVTFRYQLGYLNPD